MQKDLDPELTAWSLFRGLCSDYLEETGDTKPRSPEATGPWASGNAADDGNGSAALRIAVGHAAALGFMTAELHLALGTYTEEPDLRPDPVTQLYQRSLYQSLRAGIKQELAAIRRLASRAPAELHADLSDLLSGENSMLATIGRIRELPTFGQRIRIHGNYRLNELRMIDGDFYVMDLSGDHTRPMSERRLKAPPLRDVAEMIRSLGYAAQVAAHRSGMPEATAHAEHWYRLLGERFVSSYLEASAGSPALPTDPESIDALLTSFELTKALREVHWELLNRPDWLPVALHGALRLI
jgi:trehalose synthase-fused probable maltokinase